ncbi:Peptidyl-prolyl cis-trans isomerase B2 [Holothuria leucospilota]|uniref:Peptidyl-prolyl cis-trans isomerase n=1 Tax=Holothuria leucospilota TaxID=206669 RepID=A0A9Q0YJP0_HOLLE|nr:Peptidyl-prolyl cis-trans isomerase B2 [Holothuria leucospilota]
MRGGLCYEVTDKVYFDINAGTRSGRVVIGLFGGEVPKTVENFKRLAEGLPNGIGYKETKILRVITGFMIKGGDVINNDGTGVYSIYNGGNSFDDENFLVKNRVGVVTMANAGPNTNGCQFMILLGDAEWLNNRHVAFGEVLEGMELLLEIGATTETAEKFQPVNDIVIVDSGVL